MNRDYYYFREVFLGLREEYLKNKLELEKLKKYMIYDDNKIKDFYFWLFQRNNDLTQLWLYYEEKKKDLLSVLKSVLRVHGLKTNVCLVDRECDNKSLSVVNNSKYNIEIDDNFVELFNDDVEKILQSDFVKHMCFQHFDEKADKSLDLTLTKLAFGMEEYYFDYFSFGNEMLSVTNSAESKSITVRQILNILDEKIPKSYFSEYHQEVIEKNSNLKEVEFVDDIFNGGYAELEIKEKDGIVLCKKRKNNR